MEPNTTAAPVTPVMPVSATPPVTPSIKYAGFWIRWVALFIDNFLLGIVSVLIGLVFLSAQNSSVFATVVKLIGILIGWIYFIIMTNSYGATLGKKAVGIKVVAEDGSKLSLGRIILRETIGKIISYITLLIGFIMAGFTAKKQALHDKMAGSVVVYKDPTGKRPKAFIIIVSIVCGFLVLFILGIFLSVVLASLNAAREKGLQAQTDYQQQMQQISTTTTQ